MKAWNHRIKPDSAELMRLLGELYATEEEKLTWLMRAQPILNGKIPMDLIGTPKGYEKCVNALQAACDGVYL